MVDSIRFYYRHAYISSHCRPRKRRKRKVLKPKQNQVRRREIRRPKKRSRRHPALVAQVVTVLNLNRPIRNVKRERSQQRHEKERRKRRKRNNWHLKNKRSLTDRRLVKRQSKKQTRPILFCFSTAPTAWFSHKAKRGHESSFHQAAKHKDLVEQTGGIVWLSTPCFGWFFFDHYDVKTNN